MKIQLEHLCGSGNTHCWSATDHSNCLVHAKKFTSSAHYHTNCTFYLPKGESTGTRDVLTNCIHPGAFDLGSSSGWVNEHLIQNTLKEMRIFLETSRDWHEVPRQQSALTWFCMNSPWLEAGKTVWPFPASLHSFVSKQSLNWLNYPEALWVLLTTISPGYLQRPLSTWNTVRIPQKCLVASKLNQQYYSC